MSLPFKIKKMAISEVDSSFIIDEIVSSIAKIKKQKQRPNTERIFSMMVKSHPELTLSCLNEAIEKAIQEGLVVNYLHNGVYSYRVVPTNSETLNKFVSDRSVEEAVKWLFYDGKLKEFTVDDLECSVKQHFSPGSMFSGCLRDVIVNACGELVQLGELTYARGVYTKNMSVHEDADIKQFTCTNNNDNDVKNNPLVAPRDSTLLKKNEPPDIKDNSPIEKFVKVKKRADFDLPSNREDLKLSDDTHISSKESFSNLQSPSSDASSDKPKKKKARSLQVSFLFDSLSNFFSISGEKRRASRSSAEKSANGNSSNGSKSSRRLTVEANKSHINTKKASKTSASKSTSNLSDWSFDQQPAKKKSKALPKITPIQKKSSLQTSNDHSIKFAKTPSILHSALDELDFNEVNLASINSEDQEFFSNHTRQTIPANQSVDIAFGRFLLTITNLEMLQRAELRQRRLVMCEFCLQMLESSRSLERHLMKCGLHCPPGNEMYRLNDIKLFHLASRDQPVYSRRLGQLIQLLCIVEHTSHASVDDASTKLLENDVSCVPGFEELNHFILTIQDRSGSHLAGILSYHEMTRGYWSVTCLFVLPQYRNQGHAKCLVNLVYRMASMHGGRVKLDIPLKNHVLNLFQSVWRSLIVDYIINVEPHKLHFQLEDIARATSIELKDVTSSLSSLKMESDFYLTEQAVDMTQSQKEEMRRGSESHLLLSGLETPFSFKSCANTQELLDSGRSAADDLGGSYQKRHIVLKSTESHSTDVLERIWALLTSLGVEAKTKICSEHREETRSRKRKYEDDCHKEAASKRFQQSNQANDSQILNENHEDTEQHAEANRTPLHDDSNPEVEPSNGGETFPAEKSVDVVSGGKHSEDQTEESKSSVARSDGDMPSLDDQIATPSTAASSVGVTMSSPSPPDLKRENSSIAKDEVTLVSSVRSDHSEVDVGGPNCSPMKGQSSLPSSVKNVTSQCSNEDEQQMNSSKNMHEDDDCTVVAIETAANNPCPAVSYAEPISVGFSDNTRHYHHHGNVNPSSNEDEEKRMRPHVEHERGFCGDVSQYIDATKHHHQPPNTFFATPNRHDASYNRQCQSVAPSNCNNNNNSSKSGKSKKSSKLPDDDAGFCGTQADRMSEKISSGMNSMQERCNSVFVDPGNYPPLPFNQSPGNSQLFQRPLDYIDGRVDRPATRCGFESSFPQHFNADFPPRFTTPHPSNLLEPNAGYQMQDRNLQSSCMPPAKLNQTGSYGSNRSQQSNMNKSSKRSNKSQSIATSVCYTSSKSSNVHTNSPTIGGTIPMPSEPLLNAIYRFPNMTQGFEIPSPGYGLSNRFASESNKPNFVPPNSYFGQQSSPPGACQIQSQHNSNQSLSQHVNRGSNNGNTSDSVLHHRTSDEASHQQALFLQHQRQQQAAYLNPAAYFAKLHQFHSEFGQFQYPAPFHSSSSPTPIDMSLHVPARPPVVDGKSSLLGMQQHRESFSEVDFFQSYKMFNLGPYPGSVDPRNIVHRNPQNQVAMFGHQQQPQLESGIQSPYSAYLNGGSRVGNDLFPNSNLGDLVRK